MTTSIKLDGAEHERLRALGQARDRTPHYLMREAIRQYLTREEARESFRIEAATAWLEYCESGLHLKLHEISEWLDGWGSPDSQKAPQCHD